MKRLQKHRAASRTMFSKNGNELEHLVNTDGNENEVRAQYDLFTAKSDALKLLDEEIYNLYLQDEAVSEEDLVKELEYCDQYKRRYALLNVKVQEFLKGKSNASEMDHCSHVSLNSRSGKRNFKLPTIQFKTFDGNIKDWLPFWAQFSKVHDDPDIDLNDKVEYLLQATVPNSKARQLVESFPTIGKHYQEIIDCLKARFGREDLQIEIYVRELLKLIINNATAREKIDLSTLYDGISTQLRALETLGVASEGCASMLFPLIESCLPEELLRVWQRSPLSMYNQPMESSSMNGSLQGLDKKFSSELRLNNLMIFLKNEVEGEERITLATEGFGLCSISNKPHRPTAAGLLNHHEQQSDVNKCLFCDKPRHESSNCFIAQSYAWEKRKEILVAKNACFRCLKPGHQSRKCRARVKCIICTKSHVALMCPQSELKKVPNSKEQLKLTGQNRETAGNALACTNGTGSHVFLQTLKVNVIGSSGFRLARVLIDTGSQNTYILKSTAEKLGYKVKRQTKIVHALFGGAVSEMSHECFDITLSFGKYKCVAEALSQPSICADVSPIFNGFWIDELKTAGVHLSDLGNSGPIEILVGSDLAGKLYTGRKLSLSNGLVAVETFLGWTLMGRIPLDKPVHNSLSAVSLLFNDASLTQLWQLDILGITDSADRKSKDQVTLEAKQFFLETVNVDEDGRFEIRLPWVEGHPPISNNYAIAKRRLENTLKRLENDGLFKEYDQVFREWEHEGVIEKVALTQTDVSGHYLPHRPVVKEGSTTKIRPVFDASAREKNCPSLNQCLEKGPNLIEQIPDILVRFRANKIGVSADIRKAFLQISVHPKDRNFLRFIWIDPEGHEIVYRHRRVVFGVNSSPFLLAATLDHHLSLTLEQCRDKESSYTENFVSLLKKSFYVDNCVTSAPNEETLRSFMRESSMILAEAKFELRGWEYSYQAQPVDENCVRVTPLLGLLWDTQNDTLSVNKFAVKDLSMDQIITKRLMLSTAQKIFDPIGFTCPAMLIPKLLLQRTWEKKLSWDVEVEPEISELFKDWLNEVNVLWNIKVPRWIFANAEKDGNLQLHVFCDASKSAYAAVVFLRCNLLDKVHVSLVMAKSRVAPIRSITIPRLELLAAVIGTRLAVTIKNSLERDLKCVFWTDSSTVLSWITRNENWGTFVHNRVKEIQAATSPDDWRHVPGVMNPADLPSRGCSPRQLLQSRWWEGPCWLQEETEAWPNRMYTCNEDEIVMEKKKKIVATLSVQEANMMTSEDWHLNYFSMHLKSIRMIAWVKRFIKNSQRKHEKLCGELTVIEIEEAETFVLKLVQKETFGSADSGQLKTLNAFTDEHGLIRLRSSISAREDHEYFIYPIVLPSKHFTVSKIIFDTHIKSCHVRTQGLLCLLRERFWILGGRRSIKAVIGKCVVCRRYNSKPGSAIIPPLPLDRVRDATAFEVTGVDLAGPVFLKNGEKAWICLFTCAVFRAVHLELYTSLSVSNFLGSLRRFVARRGRPKTIFSDNGTNFVGTDNAFALLDWNKIITCTGVERIAWKFNPPTASWWGGFWERLVGLLKQLLRKTLGRASLSYEELNTVLCDCEVVINSRPLTYISNDPTELKALTPMMFLREPQESGVPDCEQLDAQSLCKRVLYVHTVRQDLRKRFRSEYLGRLSSVQKGRVNSNVKIGDVFLIGNDKDKRMDWSLGLVEELLPGKDGEVRLVRLKTTRGYVMRPIQRLYPLECSVPDTTSKMIDPTDVPVRDSTAELDNHTLPKEDESVKSAGVIKSRVPDLVLRPVVTRSGRCVKFPKKYL